MSPRAQWVHVPTQEDYETLMRAYGQMGWESADTWNPPCISPGWGYKKEFKFVEFGEAFTRAGLSYVERSLGRIISLEQAIDILKSRFPDNFAERGYVRPPRPRWKIR